MNRSSISIELNNIDLKNCEICGRFLKEVTDLKKNYDVDLYKKKSVEFVCHYFHI